MQRTRCSGEGGRRLERLSGWVVRGFRCGDIPYAWECGGLRRSDPQSGQVRVPLRRPRLGLLQPAQQDQGGVVGGGGGRGGGGGGGQKVGDGGGRGWWWWW
ncbi:Protein of unknown function [Gryllus bimaculatus]|nr:Protein of unknown function [Gryllus bimaculatus]